MSSSKSGCLLESRRRDGSPNLRRCKIGGIVCSASGFRNARGWSPTGLQGDEVPAPKDSRRWGRQGVSGGGFFGGWPFRGLAFRAVCPSRGGACSGLSNASADYLNSGYAIVTELGANPVSPAG